MLEDNYIMQVHVIIYSITRNTLLILEGKKEQYRNPFLIEIEIDLTS